MKLKLIYKGGPGSGFHGHAGRPGEIGGSTSDGTGKLDSRFTPNGPNGFGYFAEMFSIRVSPKGNKFSVMSSQPPHDNTFDTQEEAYNFAVKFANELDKKFEGQHEAPKQEKPKEEFTGIPKAKLDLADKFYSKLGNDDKVYNIAVGLMADGVFPDIMNLNVAIDDNEKTGWLDPDDINALTRNFDEGNPNLSVSSNSVVKRLIIDWRTARHSKGWDRYNKKTEPARLEWERKYYGRTFENDHEAAEDWAANYIDKFIGKL